MGKQRLTDEADRSFELAERAIDILRWVTCFQDRVNLEAILRTELQDLREQVYRRRYRQAGKAIRKAHCRKCGRPTRGTEPQKMLTAGEPQ